MAQGSWQGSPDAWTGAPAPNGPPAPQSYGQQYYAPPPPKKTEWQSYMFGGAAMIVLAIIMFSLYPLAPGVSGSVGGGLAGWGLIFLVLGVVMLYAGRYLRKKEEEARQAYQLYTQAQHPPQYPPQS